MKRPAALSGSTPRPAGCACACSTPLGAELRRGDSIAVNGVCLTVTSRRRAGFSADVSPETLPRDHARRARRRPARQPRTAAARRRAARRTLRARSRRRHGPRHRHSARRRVLLARRRICRRTLAPLSDRQRVDRRRRHQPDGRLARRRPVSACRSCRSRGRTRRLREAPASATASISKPTCSASTSRACSTHGGSAAAGRPRPPVTTHDFTLASRQGRIAAVPPFAPVEDALAAIRAGQMIVVVDDEDRENEGDLTMAASKVTPEAINFMVQARPRAGLPGDDARAARRARDSARGVATTRRARETAMCVSIDAQGGHVDRHLGGRSRADDSARRSRRRRDAARSGAARARVSAARAGRRRAGARRAHRGGGRSGAHRRAVRRPA